MSTTNDAPDRASPFGIEQTAPEQIGDVSAHCAPASGSAFGPDQREAHNYAMRELSTRLHAVRLDLHKIATDLEAAGLSNLARTINQEITPRLWSMAQKELPVWP